MIDAWQNHGLFRVLVWGISMIALTYPQWLPSLRKRFVTGRPRGNHRDTAFQSAIATQEKESIHSEAQYTAQTPEEILDGLEGLTSIQAEWMGGIHLGLRIRASGVINDVESDLRGSTTKAKVWFCTTQGSAVWATFADGFEATARTLNVGMFIKVDGEIEQVSAGAISLRDSNLDIYRVRIQLETSSSGGV